MALSKLKKVEQVLSKAIPEEKALSLGEDVFLTGPELDGSDKVYGFFKSSGELNTVTRSCDTGYPVNQMDEEDIDYIVRFILDKIKKNKYKIVEIDDL